MTMDHRLRETVDAFVARVRRDLDAHVQGLQADLLRIATENQEYWRSTLERAVTDARQDAERGFKARLEALRNELTREMDVRLVTERAQLQAATNAAVQATQAAAEAAQHAQAQAARAQAAQAEAALVATRTTAAGEHHSGARDARVDTLERLLGAVRRIDEANSLTAILQALSDGAATQTARVALLIVDGDHLKPWAVHGFDPGHAPRETTIGTSGLLTATVALKQTSFVKPLIAREMTTPGFMQVPVGHTGLVVPLIVGGEVVAVLYADDVGHAEEQEDAPVWTEEIDLLVRHASVRLENVTSVRTAEVYGS
jgi:multidrug efflux pump subunit AcrA (membrane-fusion protein)